MRWDLDFRFGRRGSYADDAFRVWGYVEYMRSLHPLLGSWRPVRDTREEAEVAPPLEWEMMAGMVQRAAEGACRHVFGVTVAFCGDIEDATILDLTFGLPELGDVSLGLNISDALGSVLNADEVLADAMMVGAAARVDPVIGGLSRRDHPGRNLNRDGPEPYWYEPGWKMFFHGRSPYYARAVELSTGRVPVAGGAVLTFGTPDTYPSVLDQW